MQLMKESKEKGMLDTNLSQAVEAVSDLGSAYDTNIKYLLADKQVLARILKYSVTKFRTCP